MWGVIFAYRIRIARIPSGWLSCYSPLIKKYSSRMEIRVIREIRVLLNIEILVFFRLKIYERACMSITIHQTMSYLYLPDSIKGNNIGVACVTFGCPTYFIQYKQRLVPLGTNRCCIVCV